jgi:hypothetical protein
MNLVVLSCAEQEMADAVDYYNRQCAGLGYEFAAEIQRGFKRIQTHPLAWPSFSSRSRRCLTDRFPYGILYEVRIDSIVIGGIMHLKQDPATWSDK